MLGVVITGTASPARAQDGFWVSIASGVAGASAPTSYQDWWFETPHGPPPVAVTQLSGVTAQATTGGGSSFFTGAAVPVILTATDGYAYLTAGATPSELSQALKQQMAGGQGLASTTPVPSAASVPASADRLAINQTTSATGVTTLALSLTSPSGTSLVNSSVSVPDGGWWVLGLGANPNAPVTVNPASGSGSGSTSTPVPVPGAASTPEPATVLLAGVGGLSVIGWRRINRRRSQ
ncbi:hypothetical protein FTUN_3828 [Frigoriglobus tundricola]|uniref:Ice-binding protein C-terminal domain-containing protein n=1 Tax=Frigoriglobus tundricola TaxID=2774151 RepID=A0A6M5YSK4_9BACT|nr:hypothetical protein FTUN_3828 [Frigoriglobus tundricola]